MIELTLTLHGVFFLLFTSSAAGKVLAWRSFRETVASYGLPAAPVARRLAWLVPVAEAGAAVLWLLPGRTVAAAAATTGLLAAFVAGAVLARRAGYTGSCGCGGAIPEVPVGLPAVARNLAVAAGAASVPVLEAVVTRPPEITFGPVVLATVYAVVGVLGATMLVDLAHVRAANLPFRPPRRSREGG